jgi:hypothetical protein
MKIRPVRAAFFFTRMDRHNEANGRFSLFCRTRLKWLRFYHMRYLFNKTLTNSIDCFPKQTQSEFVMKKETFLRGVGNDLLYIIYKNFSNKS